jgi:uncharacterized membrane protein
MAHAIEFRNRAHEVSRLEAFSDVIFGFSVSLLVVSLEAPKSYGELMEMMRGFLPFAICFFLFIDFWFEHHHFFKRYALQDGTVVALNTFLLFVVLFYVYPLKFMMVQMVGSFLGEKSQLSWGQAPRLFTIYGAGFSAIFLLLGAMYAQAWKKRDLLGLNEVEKIDTKERIWDNFCTASFGIVSMILANMGLVAFAGMIYFLVAVPKTLVPWIHGLKRRKAEQLMLAASAAA